MCTGSTGAASTHVCTISFQDSMTKIWMLLNIQKYSLYYFTKKEFLKKLDFEIFNILQII
jgi:hypothetical protein